MPAYIYLLYIPHIPPKTVYYTYGRKSIYYRQWHIVAFMLGMLELGEARRGCKRKAQNLMGSMPYTLFYKRTWGEDEFQYLNTSLMEYILLSASKEKY